jgi:hypothetical protein
LESHITPPDQAEWQEGSIEDWVMEGHRLAQTVAYRDLSNENPAPNTPEYERQAEPVIELQLEKAGVRLAYLLKTSLMHNAAAQNPESKGHKALSRLYTRCLPIREYSVQSKQKVNERFQTNSAAA